jgi:hypothetical protein
VEAGGEKIIQVDNTVAGEREQNGFRDKNGGIEDVVDGYFDHKSDEALGERDESYQHDSERQPECIRLDIAQ